MHLLNVFVEIFYYKNHIPASIIMALKSPLHDLHKELGARFTEFAGFEMPIQYTSIKDEHLTVRKSVGIFDVSHMSNIWITGEEAEELISLTTVEDASKIADGKSQYTAILREDGTVIDDAIFMHLGEKYMMIPNAGMAETATKWLNDKAIEHNICATVENVSRDYVIIAVQGPKSRDTLQKLTKTDLKTVDFFGCRYIKIAGVDCIISHTGYTGELGFELQITPTSVAEKAFRKILEAGEEFKIKPIGLGARDTLRLEKCFILAGNEFEGGRTPLEATMSWTINWNNPTTTIETIKGHKKLESNNMKITSKIRRFFNKDLQKLFKAGLIEENGDLASVSALINLKSIGGNLYIKGTSLASLDGLDNIEPSLLSLVIDKF